MPDEAAAVPLPLRHRVRHGLRRPANWWQLVRFGAVGASGYVANLVTFAAAVHAFGVDYRIAAIAAFVVGVTNNFWWNRRWTFAAHDGHAGFQAARFFVVSLGTFLVSLLLLEILVRAGLPQVASQALAIVASTPLNFLGNKLWSFRG